MQHHRRPIILLFLVLLLAVAAVLDPVHGLVREGLDFSRQMIRHHEILGLLFFVILAAISSMVFFFSSALFVPVAVYAWGKPATIVLLWGSWLLGAVVSYWIGRKPGRRLAKWMVSSRRVAKYEQKITAQSNFPLVLLFQLAVPSEIPGYVLGALCYDFWKYLIARTIAELPFAIGSVYMGYTFVQRQYVLLMVIAIVGIIFSVVSLYLLHKRIQG